MRFLGAEWSTIAHHHAGSGPPTDDEEAARLRAAERRHDITWWRWWALDAWLDAHPEVNAVVWCEDDLRRAFFDFNDADDVDDGWALSRGMFASVELERRGINALLLAPATEVGLTPVDIEQIESIVGISATRRSVDCTTCERRYHGPHDVTADISPPPPTAPSR